MRQFAKVFISIWVFLGTLAVFVGIASLWWASQEFNKPTPLDHSVEIVVPSGANIGGVAELLSYQGVIKGVIHGLVFENIGRLTGMSEKIKAGEYQIPAHASMREILDLMVAGKVLQRNVTIREGLTSYEALEILKTVKELKFSDIEVPTEGSLLPETYSYTKNENAKEIIHRMQAAMQSALDELWATRAENLPFESKEQALTLASIVEKETGKPEERARVAGVFINRLRQGVPLQTDPTVIYAMTGGRPKNNGQGPIGRRLLKKDLELDSPYNTYLHTGLPPGPIGNPGRAALEAVLHPETHEYLYFVADGTGGHVFSKTLSEHNQNVNKWRVIRKNQENSD